VPLKSEEYMKSAECEGRDRPWHIALLFHAETNVIGSSFTPLFSLDLKPEGLDVPTLLIYFTHTLLSPYPKSPLFPSTSFYLPGSYKATRHPSWVSLVSVKNLWIYEGWIPFGLGTIFTNFLVSVKFSVKRIL